MKEILKRLGWSSVYALGTCFLLYYIILVCAMLIHGQFPYGSAIDWFEPLSNKIFIVSAVLGLGVGVLTYFMIKEEAML